LIFNWWSLFVRLAEPDHRPEAITSRPLLMQAIARQTQHAGQVTLTISSTHGEQHKARRAYLRIAGFLARLRQTAEQLDPVQRWYRILSEALKRYLKGRQLDPPLRLAPGQVLHLRVERKQRRLLYGQNRRRRRRGVRRGRGGDQEAGI